jgi:hypothetical protein
MEAPVRYEMIHIIQNGMGNLQSLSDRNILFVMAGLVPAIHVFFFVKRKDVDARHKAGHDERKFGLQTSAGPRDWRHQRSREVLAGSRTRAATIAGNC